jgi:hypothetical protein
LDPTADEIERHIEDCLARLRSNLNEIEQRAKSFIDWREQYRRRPGTALGFAFGCGLLAGLVGWKTRKVAQQRRFVDRRGGPQTDQMSRWDNVQRELIGIATAVVADVVAKLVLGFKEHSARTPGTRFTSNTNERNGVQREGDYRAARRYRRAAECLIDTVDAARAGRGASPRTEAKQTVDRAPRPRDVAAAASPGGPDHIGRRCNPGPWS